MSVDIIHREPGSAFTGEPLDDLSSSNLPDARNPPIFEKGTDQSRGDATDLDLQQWKDAHKGDAQSQN